MILIYIRWACLAPRRGACSLPTTNLVSPFKRDLEHGLMRLLPVVSREFTLQVSHTDRRWMLIGKALSERATAHRVQVSGYST